MEVRYYKMFVRKPGGNASKNAKGYQISIPPKWAKALGVTEMDRLVKLSFDGSSIFINKADEISEECSSEGKKEIDA